MYFLWSSTNTPTYTCKAIELLDTRGHYAANPHKNKLKRKQMIATRCMIQQANLIDEWDRYKINMVKSSVYKGVLQIISEHTGLN